MPVPVDTATPPAPLAGPAAVPTCWGRLPFGFVAVRVLKGVDLRTLGSGNIGATNAMRVLGRAGGVAVFAGDLLKGILPVLLLARWASEGEGLQLAQVLCGYRGRARALLPPSGWNSAAVRGVATACGVVVAIDPYVFLIGRGRLAPQPQDLAFRGVVFAADGLDLPDRRLPAASGWLALHRRHRSRGPLDRDPTPREYSPAILRGRGAALGQRIATGSSAS